MKKVITRLMPVLVFIQLVYIPLAAQPATSHIDALMTEAMEKFQVVGASIGVVKDGKVLFEKGYGVKKIGAAGPVNEHTNFAIASNSKAFTTTALALLVEEGKLRWDDKVKDHIPEFKMYNPYVTENFIIEDLLTHRSGLGLGVGDLMFFPDGADFTIDDLLSSFQHFEPVSPFRTKFDYDNLLYIVAGEVIKRASGMTWEEFIAKRIFEPLGMDNSYPALDWIKDKSNLAAPHNSEVTPTQPLPDFREMINGAAGGIYANVNDLCQWMLLQLNEGRYGDSLENNLFSAASQRKMWKLHTVMDASTNPRYNSHFNGYGLGWGLSDKLGNMMVEHTGGLPGMLSRTLLVPDMELGIVVLTNTSDAGAGLFVSVVNTLLDDYLGLDDFGWIDRMAANLEARRAQGDEITQKVWETVEQANDALIDKNKYIGVYEDRWFGKMEVLEKDGQLWMKSHRSPKLNGRMYFYKANTFAVKWDYQDMNCDAFAMFSLDEEGKAQSIKMKGISPNIDFSFDFHDLDLRRVE